MSENLHTCGHSVEVGFRPHAAFPAVGAAADCGLRPQHWPSLATANHHLSRPGFTYLTAACRVSWIPAAAAVWACDDFKQVAVRVFEVDTASVVVVIDLT